MGRSTHASLAAQGGRRTALVAGAGLAGMIVATALSQRSWKVTVYERSPYLREFGAGIWLWDNGIRALDAVGALSTLERSRPRFIRGWEIRDTRNRCVYSAKSWPKYIPTREHLYQAVLFAAQEAGVEFVRNSSAIGATESGELLLEGGECKTADLVIGADGVSSAIRESLGLTRRRKDSASMAMRMLVARKVEDVTDYAEEHWSANRSLLYTPVDTEWMYLCFGCSANDVDARVGDRHINRHSWAESFPAMQTVVARAQDAGRWDPLSTVVCHRWSNGRVALVGDAAHALPPTLGQAANIAFSNCVALAEYVSDSSDVVLALRAWESAVRPITDHVQRWSRGYARISHLLPERFDGLRMRSVGVISRVPWIEHNLTKAVRQPLPSKRTETLRREGRGGHSTSIY